MQRKSRKNQVNKGVFRLYKKNQKKFQKSVDKQKIL